MLRAGVLRTQFLTPNCIMMEFVEVWKQLNRTQTGLVGHEKVHPNVWVSSLWQY